jgi:hypothetical protein
MSRIDHAAAHERIADLLLEPARLAALERSGDPDDVALREHLAACRDCREDLDTWRRLGRAVTRALPSDARAAAEAVEPIDAPPSLRARVIGAVHEVAQAGAALEARPPESTAREGAAGAPVPLASRRDRAARRARRLAPWLGLAASIAVILGASWITLDQARLRLGAQQEAAALSEVVATMDRVLAEDHEVVELRAVDGSSAGSISWSRHDWVVLTSALAEPPTGLAYRCWLEDGDRSVAIGEMEFAGGTAYWVAAVDDWQTWEIGPTTRFIVSRESGNAASRTGEIVLSADLDS